MKLHLLLVALVCITACTPAQQQPIDGLPEKEVTPPPEENLEEDFDEIIEEEFIDDNVEEELFTDDDFLWVDDIEDVEIGQLI